MTSAFVPLVPRNLAHPPVQWSATEVKAWLKFCVEEFSLSPICTSRFDMNGKALCLLTRTDFMERAPHAGDVLHNVFQRLRQQDGTHIVCHPSFQPPVIISSSGNTQVSPNIRQSFVPILPQPRRSSSNNTTSTSNSNNGSGNNTNLPTTSNDTSPCIPVSTLSPASLERSPSDSDSSGLIDNGTLYHDVTEADVDTKPDGEMCPSPYHEDGTTSGDSGCRLLWEFVHQLLQDQRYSDLVCWESEPDLTFRINNQAGLADLWGQQKNKNNMTYEKLSRALRYYYKMNIIKKVPGRRLTYRFLQHPTKIRRGQRGAKPHASRVMAEMQQDVAPDVTSSSILDAVSSGVFEGKEDTKEAANPISAPMNAADTTESLNVAVPTPSSPSTDANSVQEITVTCSSALSPSSSHTSSSESPMSLPTLLSSSISVVSTSARSAGATISPPMPSTDSVAFSTEEDVQKTLPQGVVTEASKYYDPKFDGHPADENLNKSLSSQDDPLQVPGGKQYRDEIEEREKLTSDDQYHTVNILAHGQQEFQGNLRKSPLDEQSNNNKSHILCRRFSDSDLESKPPHLTQWDENLRNRGMHLKLENTDAQGNQQEQNVQVSHSPEDSNVHIRKNQNSPPYGALQQAQQPKTHCPSPLVYTELTTRVIRRSSPPRPQSRHVHPTDLESPASTHLTKNNGTKDKTCDILPHPAIHQSNPGTSHFCSCRRTPTQYCDPNICEFSIKRDFDQDSASIVQNCHGSEHRSRPATPYSELCPQLQNSTSSTPGNVISRRSSSDNIRHSLSPLRSESSFMLTTSPTIQLQYPMPHHPFHDKRKAVEHIDICNTFPAHQKRICLSHRNLSPLSYRNPSPSSIGYSSHDISHDASGAHPISESHHTHHTDPHQPIIPYLFDSRNGHNQSPLPQINYGPPFRHHGIDFSREYAKPHVAPNNMHVMDLSRPIKLERQDSRREQEEPEDLSLKPKQAQPVVG